MLLSKTAPVGLPEILVRNATATFEAENNLFTEARENGSRRQGRQNLKTMDKEYVMSVAETIRQQLLALTPMNVILSWGIRNGFMAAPFNQMATLRFDVNARLFTGQVVIAYNEMDYYMVYLRDSEGMHLKLDEIYFDQLGDCIDELIERGTDPAEYDKFCEEQRRKLMSGDFG